MFKIVGRIIKMTGNRKKRLYIGFLFSFLISMFTAMPIMGAAYGLNLILEDYTGKRELDFKWIIYILVFMIITVMGRFIFSYLRAKYQDSIGYEVTADERIKIGDILKGVSFGFFDEYSTGDLTSAVTTDLSFIEMFEMKMVDTIVNGYITSFTMVLCLTFYNWQIPVISIISIILSAFFLKLLGNRSKKNAILHQQAQESMIGSTIEYIRGLAIVKAFNEEGASSNGLKEAYNRSKNVNIKIEKEYVPYNCFHLGVLKLASTAIVMIAAYFTLKGSMQIFIMLMMTIFSFIIFSNVEAMNSAIHVLETIDQTLDKLKNIEEAKFIDLEGEKITLDSFDIEFKDVSFSYDTTPVLKDLSFKMPQNTTTAIVGPSGGGKSTICNLIARFYDVQRGKITIGGVDIKKLNCDSLLSNISMVFQKVYLFNDTVKNNIKFGKPTATDEEVMDATKKAKCHDFIMKLPQGYDSVIGEGGSSLSGGEKQRISIARAILKNAPIVILDEATASIDPENEHHIQQAIGSLTKGKTIIIIAHRIATIEKADQILVIRNGELEESGNHDRLMYRDGTYKRFVDIRKKTEDWSIC